MLSLQHHLLAIGTVAIAVAFMGCSDETDEASPKPSELGVDAGVDVDPNIPSVESIDFESTETTERPTIHIESARHRGVISETPPLSTDSFLTEEMAQRIIVDTDLTTQSIEGQDVSQTQNSVRYAPLGADHEFFGLGLQIWDMSDRDVEPQQRVDELRDQFLGTGDADDEKAPSGAFISQRTGIRSLVFTADTDPYVFVLSCDTTHCERWDALYELGTEIAEAH